MNLAVAGICRETPSMHVPSMTFLNKDYGDRNRKEKTNMKEKA